MYLVSFLFVIPFLVSTRSEDELVAVSVLIRHGQRAPLSYYPTDPYRNTSLPLFLDLTPTAMKDMFGAGKWLRRRYTNFLSERYKPEEIYARSISYQRTLMTSQLVLAGLYPPTEEETWNPLVLWQPIPVHSSYESQDIVVNMLQPCPDKITAVIAAFKSSPEYPVFEKRFGVLLEYLSEKSGEHVTIKKLYSLFDTLYSEKSLGLPLPRWAENVYPEILPAIHMYTKINSLTPLERKIQAGPLVTKILRQFEHAINGDEFGTTKTIYRKFMPYFSTEWLIYDFGYGLGIDRIDIPNYGATLIIELRKNEAGHYVNILFRNGATPGTPVQKINIGRENYNLDFEIFKKIAQPLLTNTTEWKQLCEKFVHRKAYVATGVPMS